MFRSPPGRIIDRERSFTAVLNDHAAFGHFRPRGLVATLLSATRSAPSHWMGKRYAFLCRALGIRALRGRPMDVETGGVKMRLYPAHNNAEKKLSFTPQFFDAEERDFLLANLRDDFTFVDVGADVGGYALFVAAHAGPRARILAIEPQPDIFERLVFNIRENGFSTVKALACAVADQNGPVTLFVNPADRGATSMRLVDVHARSGEQLVVEGHTLESLLRSEGLARVDALKIDVEGAEDLVLEPFLREGDRSLFPAILIVEDLPARWGLDLAALLAESGYALVRRTTANLIYRRAA